MSLTGLLILVVVLGTVWYLVKTYVPMPDPIKVVLTIFGVLILCIALLNITGVGDYQIGAGHLLGRGC